MQALDYMDSFIMKGSDWYASREVFSYKKSRIVKDIPYTMKKTY